jgi:rhodanese-related sulfurtransferase
LFVKFLIDNILLVALMVASGAMLIWPEIQRLISGGREIGTLEATRLINGNALVLDVRDATEYAGGHIPHAKHIPLAELDKRLPEIAKFKDKPVIVSCRTGMRAGGAVRLLQKHQFSQVYQLKGGVAAWQQASLPLER